MYNAVDGLPMEAGGFQLPENPFPVSSPRNQAMTGYATENFNKQRRLLGHSYAQIPS